MYHQFAEPVVISCPIEGDAIPLMRFTPLRFSGTSNAQWMSDYYPRAFGLARSEARACRIAPLGSIKTGLRVSTPEHYEPRQRG